MKALFKDLKKGVVKLKIEDETDLWNLYMLVKIGDSVIASGFRKVEVGNVKERKPFTAEIVIEKKRFEKQGLRFTGVVTSGHVGKDSLAGVHQGVTIKVGDFVTVKKVWSSFDKKLLDKALKQKPFKILVLCFDNEQAVFALLKHKGFEVLAEVNAVKTKTLADKAMPEQFCKEIASKLEALLQNIDVNALIIASPSFWKEYLQPFIEPVLKEFSRPVIKASCSHAGVQGVKELLKRPELKTSLKQARIAQEVSLVEELKSRIAKGLATYGFKHCSEAALAGNVEKLLVSINFLNSITQQGVESNTQQEQDISMEDLERLITQVDSVNGEVEFLTMHVEELDSLSGIACFLRWKVE